MALKLHSTCAACGALGSPADRRGNGPTHWAVTTSRGSVGRRCRSWNANIDDCSAIPVHYVSEFALYHVTVVLCGKGGDEMLAGYETYRARALEHGAFARRPRGRAACRRVGGGMKRMTARTVPTVQKRRAT